MRIRSLFKNDRPKKGKIRDTIWIKQKDDKLIISGEFNKEKYFTNELWLFPRGEQVGFKVSEINPTNKFEYHIHLNELIQNVRGKTEDVFEWYFKIKVPITEISDKKRDSEKVNLFEEDGIEYAEYFIRCGRFMHTKIEGVSFYTLNEDSMIIYITTKGNLALKVNGDVDQPTKLQIDKVKKLKDSFRIEGKIFTKNSIIENGEILLRGRDTRKKLVSENITFHHNIERTERKYGLNSYNYVAEFNIIDMNDGKLVEEDIYDLFINLKFHDHYEQKLLRIGRPTIRAKLLLKEFFMKSENVAAAVSPYYTFRRNNLSFVIYSFPVEDLRYLRKTMRWAWLIRLLNRKRNVWLIGEKIYKAQDTGYAFFRYMRENYPDKEIYYVIDKNSPEKRNVEKFGNVLEFKSKEHILKTITAKKVISSHHPHDLYPLKTDAFKNKVKADKVFLQHGVLGTKNITANYGKKASGFDADFFIVSSDFEKEIVVHDLGYNKDNVFVTGLSRFDTLFKDDIVKKRQILIIPTWREWIVRDDVFFESEYYERYKSLINNGELHNLAEKYNFEIVFCLHPNMQRFTKYFEHPSVRIINQGEVDVQHLIKESALMVTDYSSVAFDFSFLFKPVIYYQFDRNRFLGKKPSHLDLDNALPGEICFEGDDLINFVESYAMNDFKMKEEYKKRAKNFVKYRDLNSSERIYNVVSENQAKRSFYNSDNKITLIMEGLYKRFRKSKYYFPTMKKFYKVGKKLIPVDKNLILFESGVGKQYGDSPRNIYEEIIKQDLDYKIIWVYNKQIRFPDRHTKRIKRLSPQYYYYLLKARYWVNNQNFPTYIKKRPQTTYLQTWHGTPLKKMLYDIEEVHGRSDDYVERVGNAVKNWDYLISPSDYATKAFRSAFHYNGKILEVGYPRNDIFYKKDKEDIIKTIQARLQLPSDKKVILYAPTFRDNQTTKKNKFKFDLNLDLEKMKEELGDEYILLLRMHVIVSGKIKIDNELSDFVFNVSNYPDSQELLLISDILMTDYSSIMFDFANTRRPLLFYTYDLDEYRDNIRGFYFDFEKEAPGPLMYNTDEIIENVKNIEGVTRKYQTKYDKFYDKFCSLEDGQATERVVNKIFK